MPSGIFVQALLPAFSVFFEVKSLYIFHLMDSGMLVGCLREEEILEQMSWCHLPWITRSECWSKTPNYLGLYHFFVRKWTAKLKKSSWNNWFGQKSSQVWILDLDFWLLHFCGLLILFCWRRCWEAKLYLLLLFFEIDDIRESFLIKISNISPLVLEVAI